MQLVTGASTYEFQGQQYPEYLKHWKASTWIQPFALYWCQGKGVNITFETPYGIDVGAGDSPLPGAIPIDKRNGQDALALPCKDGSLDYVFSSHCLEHLDNPVDALYHWRDKLRPGGVLFLYLPHPDMLYWHPDHNTKHKNIWMPSTMKFMVERVGYKVLAFSERDLYWSYAIVGCK